MAHHVGTAGSNVRKMAKHRAIKTYGLQIGFTVLFFMILCFGLNLFFLLSAFFSFFLGTLLTFFIILITDREIPTRDYIRRVVRGAQAEEMVQRILALLPDTYHVFHDLPCPLGNIDHIAVGPTGIFVIETKSHNGKITATPEGVILRDRKPLRNNVVRQARGQTFWLKEQLQSRLGKPVFVHSILIFVNGSVDVPGTVKNIAVLGRESLVPAILGKQKRFSEDWVSMIKTVLYQIYSEYNDIQSVDHKIDIP